MNRYNKFKKSHINNYLTILAFIFILFKTIVNVSEPIYDYDIIGYIASAKLIENEDKTILFEETIKELKESLPGNIYSSWFSNKSLMTDEKSLIEHLPFYQIRKGYTYGIFLLSKFGLNMVKASYYLSNIYILLSILLFTFFSLKHIKYPLNMITPFILIIFGVNLIARTTTPD